MCHMPESGAKFLVSRQQVSFRTHQTFPRRRVSITKAQKDKTVDPENPNPGLGLKAVWIGAENFGKLVGLSRPKAEQKEKIPVLKMSRKEAMQSIRDDYSQKYFVSGKGSMDAYDPDCLFADPFAGFNGVKRFKQNVSNLGSLMEDVELEILDFQEQEQQLVTKWRFSALLQLPWKPRLAAAGGTTHVFDLDTGKVTKHIESWDVEPGKVVKQLLRPARRQPESKAECFMLALSDADIGGMWLAASDTCLQVSAPVVTISLLCKAVTGQGLPGMLLGSLEGLSYLMAFAAISTKLYKMAEKGKEQS